MNITQAQIDSIQGQFQTVEELIVWGLVLLEQFGNGQVVLEEAGKPRAAVEVSDFRDSVGNSRFVGRVSIPLAEDYRINGLKLWNSAQPVVDATIPAAYLS